MVNVDEWIKAMSDRDTLRILFYLREFNPNVTIADLHKNLSIAIVDIEEKLKRLEELGIVTHLDLKYSLSLDGRRIVNNIYHELGEQIPPDDISVKI